MFLKAIKTTDLIIIFGSFAKSKADKNSDIDLFIVSNRELKLPFHLLPFKPHQIRLSEKTFLKAIDRQEDLIKEIEENHVILNNHSFYINIFWDYYGSKK